MRYGGEGGGGEEGEKDLQRDPSQDQVTLRTRVAWQAGYSGDGERKRGRDGEGGLGLIVTLLSLLSVASEGAPAASVNFRLAQTCELLGAN